MKPAQAQHMGRRVRAELGRDMGKQTPGRTRRSLVGMSDRGGGAGFCQHSLSQGLE